MTATLTEDVVQSRTSDEPGKASHIVLIPPHLRGKTTAQALVLKARIEGIEIEALCGHRWVPQRDPKTLPICERCLAIYKDDPRGHGDRDQLPDA